MTKITTQHMGAIARHIADALGDADASRAEVTLTALIGDAPVYADLSGWDTGDVSVGLTQAGVSARVLTPKIIAALFGLVRDHAPTCNRCGRFALRLTGSTWAAVTASTCPVDAGLYEAAVVPVVIGWHDGREYPEGTTHDGDGVPLDSSTIRVERGVSPMVDAALRETGATLPDVLAALVSGGASPATALRAVGEPLSQWVSDRKMREFVASAKGALTRRTGGATQPPFAAGAEAPTGAFNLREWRGVFAQVFSTDARARMLLNDSGVATSRITFTGAPETTWQSALEEAQKTGRLADLLGVALREYPSNPALRALTAPSADRDAVYAALVRLLPAQFEAAVFRLSVPSHVLPGATAPMAERAVALVRVAEQRGQLAQLAAIVRAA